MAKRLKKTTKSQYEELLNFVEQNTVLIKGKTKLTEAKLQNQLWMQFANKMKYTDPVKSAKQWKKVFAEWKVNTRRKDRSVQKEIQTTGGGEASGKTLTHQELRLLQLISRIHSGDSNVDDGLASEYEKQNGKEEIKKVEEIKIEEEIIYINSVPEDSSPQSPSQDEEVYSIQINTMDGNSSEVVGHVRNVAKPTASLPKRRKIQSRYANSLLENVCSAFKVANEKQAEGVEAIAEALNNFTAEFKDSFRLLAQAEYAKAKAVHFQTFGNLHDFDK